MFWRFYNIIVEPAACGRFIVKNFFFLIIFSKRLELLTYVQKWEVGCSIRYYLINNNLYLPRYSFCFLPPDGAAYWTINETFKVLSWLNYIIMQILLLQFWRVNVWWGITWASTECILTDVLAWQEFHIVPPKMHRSFHSGLPKMYGLLCIVITKV